MTGPRHELESEARAIRSMTDALRWAAGRVPPARFVAAVGQDEFTFDVIVRVDAATYLVFDTS